jgi:hypothetical protein
MIEYVNLKNSYIATVQMGLELGFPDPKHGNDLLHDFCKQLVENSNYCDSDKKKMKDELEAVKETLSVEIERFLNSAK